MFIPYYYKSPNTLTNQHIHNLPLFSTLELWEVLTWPSEGIWPAPRRCSLLGPFFLCCAGVIGSRVCRVPHWWFSKHHHCKTTKIAHTHTHTLINEKAKGRLNPKDDENLLKIMQSEIMGIQQSQWQMKISVMNFMYGNKVVAETYML